MFWNKHEYSGLWNTYVQFVILNGLVNLWCKQKITHEILILITQIYAILYVSMFVKWVAQPPSCAVLSPLSSLHENLCSRSHLGPLLWGGRRSKGQKAEAPEGLEMISCMRNICIVYTYLDMIYTYIILYFSIDCASMMDIFLLMSDSCRLYIYIYIGLSPPYELPHHPLYIHMCIYNHIIYIYDIYIYIWYLYIYIWYLYIYMI